MSCGSNCSCGPCRGLSGLGDNLGLVTAQPVELTSDQIADLLGRNLELGQMVSNAIEYGTVDLQQGYSFTDSVYGNVVISLDASNHLRVIAFSPVNSSVINAPPYVPPSFPCDHSVLGICLDPLVSSFETGGSLLVIGALAYLYFISRRHA